MTTYIIELESNVYNMSHDYGQARMIEAESYDLAANWAIQYIVETPERDNVGIRSIKTLEEVIQGIKDEIFALHYATHLNNNEELRAQLIGYKQNRIENLVLKAAGVVEKVGA